MCQRPDRAEYYGGCQTLKGFVVKTTGGGTRRPGLETIAEVADSTYPHRLIGFVNGTDKYVLELGNQTLRVYHDGAQVLSGGLPYQLATAWTYDEVFHLVFAPRGQAIFHSNHDIYELTCTGDAAWTLTAFASQYGPFLDANEDTTLTITPSDVADIVTLTASEDLFDEHHVGALWELTHLVDEVSLAGQFDNVSEPPFVQNATSATVT